MYGIFLRFEKQLCILISCSFLFCCIAVSTTWPIKFLNFESGNQRSNPAAVPQYHLTFKPSCRLFSGSFSLFKTSSSSSPSSPTPLFLPVSPSNSCRPVLFFNTSIYYCAAAAIFWRKLSPQMGMWSALPPLHNPFIDRPVS